MAISTVIQDNQISAVVGYGLERGFAGIPAGNLPQRVGILAETGIGDLSAFPFLSADEVGAKFGYGTPAHIMARIVRNVFGDAMGAIPTVILPVEEAAGGTATTIDIDITGTATANTTHKIVINGRDQIDGSIYSYVVSEGDSATELAPKIADAVSAVLGSPVTAVAATGTVTLTTKWVGASSAQLNVRFDVGDEPAGLAYSETTTAGAGLPSIADALNLIGGEWYTALINGISSDSTVLDALESFNGNPNSKVGRYDPTVFKPTIAFVGNTDTTLVAVTAITDTRLDETTNVLCPAPGSEAFEMEVAANMATVWVPLVQYAPHIDPLQLAYPDCPVAPDGQIGDFSTPSGRNQILLVGSSTVVLVNQTYRIVDLVTTYHPTNEPPSAVSYRYVKDLAGIDWNVFYGYFLLVNLYVYGKTIINNGVRTSAASTISPYAWKGEVISYSADLLDRALIADRDFLISSIYVGISTSNPNRFETFFKYKRTGTARVVPTTAENNPNVGELNV